MDDVVTVLIWMWPAGLARQQAYRVPICCLHQAWHELLTVWDVDGCSSPCGSTWTESRCSCSSTWVEKSREHKGQLNTSLLWVMCWLLMWSCSSSSSPNTVGQKGHCTAGAFEPDGWTNSKSGYEVLSVIYVTESVQTGLKWLTDSFDLWGQPVHTPHLFEWYSFFPENE